jgi:phosphatidylserine/phosphatidylglycerophosphate/cardiolipin synthase-like enzyme
LNSNEERIIEYGLVNTTAKKKIEGQNRNNTRFYTPTRLETYLGRRWDAKMFGSHKIHAKTLIIDPWGENPAILFGSANFSQASCRYNDENILLVKNNKEIVSVFTTEFIRMFDHYKSRYFINNFFSSENAEIRYLEDNGSWSDIYFKQTARSHKFRDREVFSGLI